MRIAPVLILAYRLFYRRAGGAGASSNSPARPKGFGRFGCCVRIGIEPTEAGGEVA